MPAVCIIHRDCFAEFISVRWAGEDIEGTLWKSATTLPDCRGYLVVDYRSNSQRSKLDCRGELSTLIYAQGI